MFGMVGMSLVFVAAQTFWLLKWLREIDEEAVRSEVRAEGEPPAEV